MKNSEIKQIEKLKEEKFKEFKEEFEKQKLRLSITALDLKSLVIKNNIYTFDEKYRVVFNGVDQYNNIDLEFRGLVPNDMLVKIATYFEVFKKKKNTYDDGRIYAAIFIDYFEYAQTKLKLTELVFMLKKGTLKDSSFKEWLIGSDYSIDGNLPYKYKFTKEQLLKKLVK